MNTIKNIMMSLPLMLVGCGSLGQLNEMEDGEFERYTTRATNLVVLVVGAAVEEGDLKSADVAKIAKVLKLVAEGGGITSVGSLLDSDDLVGYKGLGIAVALQGLDVFLEKRGAYTDDGILGERGTLVILALADKLLALADVADTEPTMKLFLEELETEEE